MIYAYSYAQPVGNAYKVDIVIDDQYPYSPGAFTAKAPVAPGLPLYPNELIIESGVVRVKADSELADELRAEMYSTLARAYDSIKGNAVRYLPLRDGVLIPMRVSFDDISLLESGYKVLSDLNAEDECFVKDHENALHKCSIAELGNVIKHARFAALALWKQKVHLQESLAGKSLAELKAGVMWEYPAMQGLPGHW